MTVATLQTLKSEENFKLFWQKVIHQQAFLILRKFPWKRRAPARLEGAAEGTTFNDCESYFHTNYHEVLHLIVNCVKKRFDQPGFAIYRNIQDILMKCISKEKYDDNLEVIASFYQSDIDSEQRKVYLETF